MWLVSIECLASLDGMFVDLSARLWFKTYRTEKGIITSVKLRHAQRNSKHFRLFNLHLNTVAFNFFSINFYLNDNVTCKQLSFIQNTLVSEKHRMFTRKSG